MAALFRVRLVALEVVDRGADLFAGLLARTDGIHAVSGDLQRLEGNHGLVVFREITDQHQNLLCHRMFSKLMFPRTRGGVKSAIAIEVSLIERPAAEATLGCT